MLDEFGLLDLAGYGFILPAALEEDYRLVCDSDDPDLRARRDPSWVMTMTNPSTTE